ncbi:MAG: c-type cytochrome domain-containing protein [Pirellulales bacterium]
MTQSGTYICGALALLGCLSASSTGRGDDQVSFCRDVAPILIDHCVACHSARKAEGGYRLDTFDDLLKPGDSGQSPITVSSSAQSEIHRRITASSEAERMPAENAPLAEAQTQLLGKWIDQGATFDGQHRDRPLWQVTPPANYPAPPATYAHPLPVTALAAATDGPRLYASGYHEVTVWDLSNGSLANRVPNVGERIYSLAISPRDNLLAVGCGQPGRLGEVRLVDVSTGKVVGSAARSADVVLDLAYRPDGELMAVASADNLIRIVRTATLETERTLSSHADWVYAVGWSSDGKRLISGSRDKSAKVYNAETGELLASYQDHAASVRGVALLGDGSQAVSCGADGKVLRWEVSTGKKIAEVALGSEGFKLVAGDNWIVVPCAGQRAVKIDLTSNTIVQEFGGHGAWVISAAIAAHDSQIVTGAMNGELRLWDASSGALVKSWLAKP